MTQAAYLINAHLALAYRIADAISEKCCLPQEDREDARGDAHLGLVYAARRYDPNRNVPFASYAAICISRKIYDGIRQRRGKIKTVPLEAIAI